MRLLIDECLPRKLKFMFAAAGHECETVRDAGFGSKTNGELLALAEGSFEVFISIDKNIRYQQNLTNRRIAVLVFPLIPEALAALESIQPGQVIEVGGNV
jgi:predicted nuclease of predicted toxin-antitoxin system